LTVTAGALFAGYPCACVSAGARAPRLTAPVILILILLAILD